MYSLSSHSKSLDGWMNSQLEQDWKQISCNKQEVTTGYLSLGLKDGLSQEGGTASLGTSFVRYYFNKFWHQPNCPFSEYSDIFTRVINAYSRTGTQSNPAPTLYHDSSLTGWEKHAVTRMVGFLSSNHNPQGPFFEILINSQQAVGERWGLPFRVTIYKTAQDLKNRWESLKIVQRQHSSYARDVYYTDKVMTIPAFESQLKKIGPNASRLLDALTFLDSEIVKTQTVGNCWIKQPKRSLLTALFIEIVVQRKELSIQEAFKLSKHFYGKWKRFVNSELNGMLSTGGLRKDLIPTIEEKIVAREKKLMIKRQ